MGMVLVAVDVVSGLLVLGAIREFNELDEKKESHKGGRGLQCLWLRG